MEKVSTQKAYLIKLADRINYEYDFNGYEITADKLRDMTKIMAETIDAMNLKESHVNEFFTKLHSGKLGIFYKQPISFLSVFQQFAVSKMIL